MIRRWLCSGCGNEYETMNVIAGACSGCDMQYVELPTLNTYAHDVYAANKKWWLDIHTGKPVSRNKGEMIALMHSELSEALEGVRKGKQDDHLPHLKSEAVELADCLIRIFDYAAGFNIDLQQAYDAKMAYNATRADHTHEARKAEGGKAF